MDALFRFPTAVRHNREVAAWFAHEGDPLRQLALLWFDQMRGCGDDVCELLHDGHPTACVRDAAFAYVDAFAAHVNVGFYQGAALKDPACLLLGSGKRMRHVKLVWGQPIDAAALRQLIADAYADMAARISTNA
ncbi:hypothetical protein FHS83_001225 [Rhizomicrobium palustre]|uniref:YdhG-like domain-containing protein n=1 Tax=Rhizomicrobium palustre TaxID=189966 RepID=A0A846MY58_9PROT|nr:DUF1801 domain-containing protein [Rhizomicrobium palustre]NIK87907.1 hypothetical protein [Rhizomicrobium palustre]